MVDFGIPSLIMSSNLDFIRLEYSLVFPDLFVAKIHRPTCILLVIFIHLPVVRYYTIGYLWFQEVALRPRGSRNSTSLEVKAINSNPVQRNLGAHVDRPRYQPSFTYR